jgi:hypothetical protein
VVALADILTRRSSANNSAFFAVKKRSNGINFVDFLHSPGYRRCFFTLCPGLKANFWPGHTIKKATIVAVLKNAAEREGFEPPEVLPSTVFKTAAFDRSAISPGQKYKFFLYRKQKISLPIDSFKMCNFKGRNDTKYV